MKDFSKLLIFVFVCELVGLISTPLTITSISTWYVFLNKPFFSPPNWIFAPVWTMLYLLMGVSAFLIWKKGLKLKKVKRSLLFFLIQLFFNFLWSLLFFGLHAPILGLLDILFLLVFIIITIMQFHKISKIAAYLLIPYLLWGTFATILNLSIVLLNP